MESVLNRYYDPSTDSFISVDPDVQETDQPYVFVNDNPLNATDPLGLKKKISSVVASTPYVGIPSLVATKSVIIPMGGYEITVSANVTLTGPH